jgi:hypothetical protein
LLLWYTFLDQFLIIICHLIYLNVIDGNGNYLSNFSWVNIENKGNNHKRVSIYELIREYNLLIQHVQFPPQIHSGGPPSKITQDTLDHMYQSDVQKIF